MPHWKPVGCSAATHVHHHAHSSVYHHLHQHHLVLNCGCFHHDDHVVDVVVVETTVVVAGVGCVVEAGLQHDEQVRP